MGVRKSLRGRGEASSGEKVAPMALFLQEKRPAEWFNYRKKDEEEKENLIPGEGKKGSSLLEEKATGISGHGGHLFVHDFTGKKRKKKGKKREPVWDAKRGTWSELVSEEKVQEFFPTGGGKLSAVQGGGNSLQLENGKGENPAPQKRRFRQREIVTGKKREGLFH